MSLLSFENGGWNNSDQTAKQGSTDQKWTAILVYVVKHIQYLSLRFMCNAILSVSSWPPACFLLSKLSPRPKPGTGRPRRTSTINGSVQCGQKLIPKLPLSVNSNHKAAISKIIMSFYCINSPVLCKGPSFQQWSTSVMIRRYRPMITPKCE